MKVGGPGPVWTVRRGRTCYRAWMRTPTTQPGDSRYTDWAIAAVAERAECRGTAECSFAPDTRHLTWICSHVPRDGHKARCRALALVISKIEVFIIAWICYVLQILWAAVTFQTLPVYEAFQTEYLEQVQAPTVSWNPHSYSPHTSTAELTCQTGDLRTSTMKGVPFPKEMQRSSL
jgi:hypothetical protein